MGKFHPDLIEFGSANFEIASVLGQRTRQAIATAVGGEAFIVLQQSRGNLASGAILTTGKSLTNDQIQELKDLTGEPRAYYAGRPIFRRRPPLWNYAIRLHGTTDVLDLMLDLHNPAWGFYCADEVYWGWNWVGLPLIDLAKQAFAELASPNPLCLWKRGVIRQLEAKLVSSVPGKLSATGE